MPSRSLACRYVHPSTSMGAYLYIEKKKENDLPLFCVTTESSYLHVASVNWKYLVSLYLPLQ